MNPKVMIGVVTYDGKDYCLERFANTLNSLEYDNYSVVIADNSKDKEHINKLKGFGFKTIKTEHFRNPKDSMINARNTLREIFLKGDCDYFFNVDSDIILPKDSIQKLLEPNKKAISGVYFNRFKKRGKEIILPILYINLNETELEILIKGLEKQKIPDKQKKQFDDEFKKAQPIIRKQLLPKDVEGDKVIEINMCGHGCMMIAREILKKISFRYNIGFDDATFCIDIEKLGYKIYARTGVKCIHIPSNNWDEILPK